MLLYCYDPRDEGICLGEQLWHDSINPNGLELAHHLSAIIIMRWLWEGMGCETKHTGIQGLVESRIDVYPNHCFL